jgi:hypothetical protein
MDTAPDSRAMLSLNYDELLCIRQISQILDVWTKKKGINGNMKPE